MACMSFRCAGVVVVVALAAAGCTAELVNAQAARDMEKASRPPGTLYTGWRVFQDKCAGCHGATASGTSAAPDLLPIVREMGPRRFMSLVLMRYDWSLLAQEEVGADGSRDALIDRHLRREQGAVRMPAWQGEPQVEAHIVDLYAYLSARAEGVQGPGRPTP